MEQQNPNNVVENAELNQQQQADLNANRRLGPAERQQYRQRLQQRILAPFLELNLTDPPARDLTFARHLMNLRHQSEFVRGLTPERIERFEQFDADESMVGEQCLICMDDLKVGTKMVRLDCHVDHYLCQKCAIGWFKDHNTCPTCRHVFN